MGFFFYLGKSLHTEDILINTQHCNSKCNTVIGTTPLAVIIHSLLSTLAVWPKACPTCCGSHCQTNTPWLFSASSSPTAAPESRSLSIFFSTALVLRHSLINAALQENIKLLPFQHSSFQASDGTLQVFFYNTNPGHVLYLAYLQHLGDFDLVSLYMFTGTFPVHCFVASISDLVHGLQRTDDTSAY